MTDFLRLITLQDANTRVVMLGAAVLGLACGVIGLFAMLRKRALAGDAVAHAALPGVCAAYFIVGERHFPALLLGALVFGLLAAAFIAMVRSLTRVKEDAATAIAIGAFFGLGIAMSRIIQNQPGGNRAGLDHFLFGKAASMVMADARLITWVAIAVLAIVALLFKELKLLCFDRAFAQSLWGGGSAAWRTHALDLLLMGLIAVCTVVGLPAVGVVLMVGLLVIPAAAARFWTDRLTPMTLLAGGIGLMSGLLGVAASAALPTPAGMLSRGWPTGPMITLVAVAIFAASLLAAPRRGVLAEIARRARVRHRVSTQNVLRAMYEDLERRGKLAVATATPVSARVGGTPLGWRRAAAQGLVAAATEVRVPSELGPTFTLTRYGLAEAAKVVRAHRVWELFLTEQASIAPDHVDRDADEIEHVLPHDLIERLEQRLREQGRLPNAPVPESVHPIGPAAGGAP